jgi:hypothetical protein
VSKVIDSNSRIRDVRDPPHEVKDFDLSDRRSRYSPKSTVIQVENGKQTNTIVICAVLCAVAAFGSVVALYRWAVTERETRMLEYYVMELDGKLMAGGLLDYNESWAAKKAARKATKEK